MNTAKHTPGPWVVSESESNGDDLISIDSENRHITLHMKEAPEDVANACLIAAAPALLLSLKDILGRLESCLGIGGQIDGDNEAIARAHAIIVQATTNQ